MTHFTHDHAAVAIIRDLGQKLVLVFSDLPTMPELQAARNELAGFAAQPEVPQEVLQSMQLVQTAMMAVSAAHEYHRWRHLECDEAAAA